jgi:phosphatidylglycerol---prolipoprotein diacylglyceryl transferase
MYFLIADPIERVAFSIFGQDIYWYAIFILFAALSALGTGIYFGKKMGVNIDHLIDGFTIGLIIGVIFARLYYVLFELDNFPTFGTIFDFRNGLAGLAIHGVIISMAFYIPLYCKWRKIDILKMFELAGPGFLLAQALGRWGNFINQEAHGPLVPGTNLIEQRQFLKNLLIPDFIVDQMYMEKSINNVWTVGYFHPTFLYEMVWNLLGFALILILRKKLKTYYMGDSLAIYLIWYGFGRFFIEALRTDALMAGSLKVAQLVSILMVLGGAALLILRRIFKYRLERTIDVIK